MLYLWFTTTEEFSNQPMSKIKKEEQISDKPKQKYQVTNWSEYNHALEKRGNITFYIDEQVIDSWYSDAEPQQGAQEVYSDRCIEAMMMIKTVFKQPYRQVCGFTKGLLKLMGLGSLRVPSYPQLNRRFRALNMAPFAIPQNGPITIAIDSTGVKVYGEGEWKCRKYGWSKRRTWRKLHLGVDPRTGFIHCHTTTTNAESDESQVDDLLDQVEGSVEDVCLDGAYDAKNCYDGLLERGINPVIPPQHNAIVWYRREPGDWQDHPRNVAIGRIAQIGRAAWKKEVDYHRRSLSETAIFRYKTIFGAKLYSRKFGNQEQENNLKIKALNQMTAHGMPISKPQTAT